MRSRRLKRCTDRATAPSAHESHADSRPLLMRCPQQCPSASKKELWNGPKKEPTPRLRPNMIAAGHEHSHQISQHCQRLLLPPAHLGCMLSAAMTTKSEAKSSVCAAARGRNRRSSGQGRARKSTGERSGEPPVRPTVTLHRLQATKRCWANTCRAPHRTPPAERRHRWPTRCGGSP